VSFWGLLPPEPHTRGSASAPCLETSVSQTFVPPYLLILVQRDHATLQRADKPCEATWCRETARRHVVQSDRATLRGAEGPRNATACRGTARRHIVQRDRATLRGAERPRDATACRGKLKSFCDRVVDRSTTGRFGPASGRTVRALPIPPHTRRRRTDSEYAECGTARRNHLHKFW